MCIRNLLRKCAICWCTDEADYTLPLQIMCTQMTIFAWWLHKWWNVYCSDGISLVITFVEPPSKSGHLGVRNLQRKCAICLISASADCTLSQQIMYTQVTAFACCLHICISKNSRSGYQTTRKRSMNNIPHLHSTRIWMWEPCASAYGCISEKCIKNISIIVEVNLY